MTVVCGEMSVTMTHLQNKVTKMTVTMTVSQHKMTQIEIKWPLNDCNVLIWLSHWLVLWFSATRGSWRLIFRRVEASRSPRCIYNLMIHCDFCDTLVILVTSYQTQWPKMTIMYREMTVMTVTMTASKHEMTKMTVTMTVSHHNMIKL